MQYCSSLLRATAVAAMALLSPLTNAQTTFELRAQNLFVGFDSGADVETAPVKFTDGFANGAPLQGNAYDRPAAYENIQYAQTIGQFSAGAELNGAAGDYFGTTYGVGALSFRAADAVPAPTNLDAPGVIGTALRMQLLDPPGAGSLLNRAQSFETGSYWNFVAPAVAGESYGMRLSDAPLGGGAYNGMAMLRVGYGSNGPVVTFTQRAYDGLGTYNNLLQYVLPVSAALSAGHGMDEVSKINLELHYNAPSGDGPASLNASFELESAVGVELGTARFASTLPIFEGEDFLRLQIGANWVTAVPEPGAGLMMGVGLLGLGLWRQRRKA